MKFEKAPQPLAALAAHLREIGMGGDPAVVELRLRDVGYYRLSPYWRFFRDDPHHGSPLGAGTTIERVWGLYTFDRELRLLVLDAIERIEIGVRSRLVQAHVLACGAFGYAQAQWAPTGPYDPRGHYKRLLDKVELSLAEAVRDPQQRHLSEAMCHFASQYGAAHRHPPLWLAAEEFSFGDLVTLFRGSPRPVRVAVARGFGAQETVFTSWLLALQTTRNVCAHHGRLWNRAFGVQPKVPDKDPNWSASFLGPSNRLCLTLTILAHLTGALCDGASWAARLRALVDRYPEVPREPMGMRGGWEDHPAWRGPTNGGT